MQRSAVRLLVLLSAFGCGSDSPTSSHPAVTYNLAIVSGNNQIATFGDTLAQPLVVRVTNAASGVAVVNATVTWQPAAGNGSVSASSSTTDSSGTSPNRWILGSADSTQSVTVTTPNGNSSGPPRSVTFTATGFASGALHFVGKFDGDSTVPIGTAYDVAQHFHFVVENGSNDSVGAVAVVNLPSIQWVFQSGQAPTTTPTCPPSTGVLVLYCQSSDFPGNGSQPAYIGDYIITVQPGSFGGVANPAYRPTFDLNVTQPGTSPLTFVAGFDGDSVVGTGTPYDVSQHFHFAIQNAAGDSVGSVPVVNLASIQWVLQSGQAPATSPSCSVGTDVLVLNCPASSGTGFTGNYVVTTQPGSFNGISNPAFRPTFDLLVSP